MMSPHVLTSEEVAMVRDCCEEYGRRRGFVRVFPSHDSWDLYRSVHCLTTGQWETLYQSLNHIICKSHSQYYMVVIIQTTAFTYFFPYLVLFWRAKDG